MITDVQHDEKGKRVDVHRPSVIDPADYELAAPMPGLPWFKSGPYCDNGVVGKSCDHCGHALRYYVRFVYKPTGQVVSFGEDCADHIGVADSRSALEFNRLRERARKDEREAKEKLEIAERIAQFTQNHPDLVEWMNNHNWETEKFGFLLDMQRALVQYGYLTTAQKNATEKIVTKRREQLVERLNAPQPTTLAPEGKVTVTGTILNARHDSMWDQTKMRVELDDHNVVYGTMPGNIESAIFEGVYDYSKAKGKRVEFTANFTRKEDHFSYYSRPSKAKVV